MRVFSGFSFVVRQKQRSMVYAPFVLLLFLGALLTACSGLNFGGGTAPTGTPTQAASVALAKLHWCGKALMIFRDEGATTTGTPSAGVTPTTAANGTPTSSATVGATATATTGTSTAATGPTPVTITSWAQVQPQLGFTVYLPATLPAGTCLTSASGTIHDPIFGGSFTIGYLLADHSAVTLSEAPARSQNSSLQCSPSASTTRSTGKAATPTITPGATVQPLQVCTGVRDSTNIVFSARGTTETLTQFFKNLQSNVAWVPAS